MSNAFDNAAALLGGGVGAVDYLGSFNRGAYLAQNTTNIFDAMRAKRDMINAQESGNPQILGQATRMSQVRAPDYATSVYNAQNNQAVALGNQQKFQAEDRAEIAKQILSSQDLAQRQSIFAQEIAAHEANGLDATHFT